MVQQGIGNASCSHTLKEGAVVEFDWSLTAFSAVLVEAHPRAADGVLVPSFRRGMALRGRQKEHKVWQGVVAESAGATIEGRGEC